MVQQTTSDLVSPFSKVPNVADEDPPGTHSVFLQTQHDTTGFVGCRLVFCFMSPLDKTDVLWSKRFFGSFMERRKQIGNDIFFLCQKESFRSTLR